MSRSNDSLSPDVLQLIERLRRKVRALEANSYKSEERIVKLVETNAELAATVAELTREHDSLRNRMQHMESRSSTMGVKVARDRFFRR
ncbi:MAG: hypothetical protein P1U34_10210 [Coxiellaceae bacterium]|nr:hypothetical protein [Coxiellaceae bacterium]